MSNYHYKECKGCLGKNQYSDLQDTTKFSCDQPCLCRWTGERSTKDKMYYNWFVLDQPMQLEKDLHQQSANNNCKNQK